MPTAEGEQPEEEPTGEGGKSEEEPTRPVSPRVQQEQLFQDARQLAEEGKLREAARAYAELLEVNRAAQGASHESLDLLSPPLRSIPLPSKARISRTRQE